MNKTSLEHPSHTDGLLMTGMKHISSTFSTIGEIQNIEYDLKITSALSTAVIALLNKKTRHRFHSTSDRRCAEVKQKFAVVATLNIIATKNMAFQVM